MAGAAESISAGLVHVRRQLSSYLNDSFSFKKKRFLFFYSPNSFHGDCCRDYLTKVSSDYRQMFSQSVAKYVPARAQPGG
jgi:hypothetical protein